MSSSFFTTVHNLFLLIWWHVCAYHWGMSLPLSTHLFHLCVKFKPTVFFFPFSLRENTNGEWLSDRFWDARLKLKFDRHWHRQEARVTFDISTSRRTVFRSFWIIFTSNLQSEDILPKSENGANDSSYGVYPQAVAAIELSLFLLPVTAYQILVLSFSLLQCRALHESSFENKQQKKAWPRTFVREM